MSCWSLESLLSFMLAAGGGAQAATAGMAEPHPHRRRVPRRLPAPLPLPLPDNPKPTTRPRPRALTGRRGKGRASAPPAPSALLARAGRLRRGGARACAAFRGRLPARASLQPLQGGPASSRRRRVRLVAPRLLLRPLARAQGPSPAASRGRPAGSRAHPWRPLPPVSVCLGVSGRRLAGCLMFPRAQRASWLRLGSLAPCPHPAVQRQRGCRVVSPPGLPARVVQGSTCIRLRMFHIRARLRVPH